VREETGYGENASEVAAELGAGSARGPSPTQGDDSGTEGNSVKVGVLELARFTLNGGTALNLFLFDVPRLSVDADLNYIGAQDRATMMAEREQVERASRAVFAREDFRVQRVPSPDEHAGGKWRLRYRSPIGGEGNLEVDINFMFRVPLWPPEASDSRALGFAQTRQIPVLNIHELAAGKLPALFSRRASRDLFDTRELLWRNDLNQTSLRTAFVATAQ
jgi:predicted nucleotidyltransferase component of viral defense system